MPGSDSQEKITADSTRVTVVGTEAESEQDFASSRALSPTPPNDTVNKTAGAKRTNEETIVPRAPGTVPWNGHLV